MRTLRPAFAPLAMVLASFLTTGATLASTPGAGPTGGTTGVGVTIRVPQDRPTLDAAIEASTPGALILLDRGTYQGDALVPETKPGIRIRGIDRNAVIFDGQDLRSNAIVVQADDVIIENMTAHNYVGNGFYWTGVDGYAGRYLTVWNVGLYGIYAIESRHGIFEQSYVSGAADAAFYIGECNPCDAVVTDVTARLSAVGYSGTNAGGNLEVRDSLWELNGTAIMPNSFEGQAFPPPQRSSLISGNTIRDSGAQPVPANSPLAGYVGMGVAIAGGWENIVEDNHVTGSATYGIAIFPTLQASGTAIEPQLNQIRANEIADSGKADLAVADGNAATNCFADNAFDSSLPADIESLLPCGGQETTTGDPSVLAELGVPSPELLDRLGPRPSYKEMPAPDPQPNMPDVEVPTSPSDSPARTPRSVAPSATPAAQGRIDPAGNGSSAVIAIIAAGVAAALVLLLLVGRRRSRL